MNTNIKKDALVKDKDHNNDGEINTQNEVINNDYSALVKYKDKMCPSGETEETKKGKK